MVGRLTREIRCNDVLEHFSKSNDGLCFMTLTTADVVTLDEIRERWRSIRHYIKELKGQQLKYVMNYELHPGGHGWHIHAVFNSFINLRKGGLERLQAHGFGRINVEKVTSLGVADYLSKHCLKAYRGVKKGLKGTSQRLRLVNTSRGLPRLSDYHWQSAFQDRVKSLMKSKAFCFYFGAKFHPNKWKLGELCVLMGWSPAQLRKRLHDRLLTRDIDDILPG